METTPVCPSCGQLLPPNAPKGLCPACLIKGAFATGTESGAGGKTPRFVPPQPEELAARFPQLEILRLIGQGGMGAVYQVRQKQLDRIVALKILPPQAASGPGFAERFTREAQALAKLNHPQIVTLYEFGQADGLFYFLMEFVDGINLQQLLQTGRIAPDEALAIVPQICEALQFAHQRGIVHRDIKPGNILLSKEGRVKIADFGVAKIMGRETEETDAAKSTATKSGELTAVGSVLGTPQYMAPEQVAHPLTVDHRADIYSLGVVFYQMLTGELPGKRIEPPSKKVQIDVRLDEVVMRALEQKPELRFQHVSEVQQEVETIVSTPEKIPPLVNKPAAPPPTSSLAWKIVVAIVVIIGGGVLLLALVAFALFGLFQHPSVLIPSSLQPQGVVYFSAFQMDAALVDRVIPVTMRENGVMSGVKTDVAATQVTGVSSNGVFSWTDSQRVEISPETQARLQNEMGAGGGSLLAKDAQLADSLPPKLPLMWSYLKTNGVGGGTGFIGVKSSGQIRIEGSLYHRANDLRNGLVQSKFLYEGPFPPDNALSFLVPFEKKDGTRWYLVVVFSLDEGQSVAAAARTLWQPQLISANRKAVQNALASIHITDITRAGNIVIFRIASDPDFPAHLIIAGFNGPEIINPSETYGTYNYTGPDLSCLLGPSENVQSYGDGTSFNGHDLGGWLELVSGGKHKVSLLRNKQSGPGEFVYGFYLPSEATAEMVVKQARSVLLGKTNLLGDGANVLLLFDLKRFIGKNAVAKDGWENMAGSLTFMPDFNQVFGPVIERSLDLTDSTNIQWLDLDSGRTLFEPAALRNEGDDARNDWLVQSSADVYPILRDEFKGLGTRETYLIPVAASAWTNMPAHDVTNVFFHSEKIATTHWSMDSKTTNGLPETQLFRTREGGMGILQITEFTENPRGVNLNYKLVRATSTPAPDTSPKLFYQWYKNPPTTASATNESGPPSGAVPLRDKLDLALAKNLSFGAAREEVIELDDPNHRTLNLASGNYIRAPAGVVFDFGPAGTNALRAAGVDIYFGADSVAPNTLIALDMGPPMMLQPADGQTATATVDSITPEELRLLLANVGRWRDAMESPGMTDLNLRNPRATIAGTNLCVFVTREGIAGALQIIGVTDHPRGVTIHYKLLSSGTTNSAPRP